MQKNIWIIQTYVPYYQKHSENMIYYQNKKKKIRAFNYAAPARILMATEGSHVLHKTRSSSPNSYLIQVISFHFAIQNGLKTLSKLYWVQFRSPKSQTIIPHTSKFNCCVKQTYIYVQANKIWSSVPLKVILIWLYHYFNEKNKEFLVHSTGLHNSAKRVSWCSENSLLNSQLRLSICNRPTVVCSFCTAHPPSFTRNPTNFWFFPTL